MIVLLWRQTEAMTHYMHRSERTALMPKWVRHLSHMWKKRWGGRGGGGTGRVEEGEREI